MTLQQWQRRAAAALAEAGIDDPVREARYLLTTALSLKPEAILTTPDTILTPMQVERLSAWLARRCAHEPLAKIAGEKAFFGRWFYTSAATLDPRPDSETLIEAALAITPPPRRIVDVGTGTGCLLLSLLAAWPQATGIGIDISADALLVAQRNAARHGLEQRVTWLLGDMLAPLTKPVDMIISNPPYIPSGVIATLARAVRDYDPLLALDGGTDGLEAYRRLCVAAPTRLTPEGQLLLEIGAGQADAVSTIATAQGFLHPTIHEDLAGIPRVLHFVLAS